MPRRAHYLFVGPRYQLSPELGCVSHKKAESWAPGHGGILWTQLTRTSGHTSSCYTSYFCPIKAAAISLENNLVTTSPLLKRYLFSLMYIYWTDHHEPLVFPKITKYNDAIDSKKYIVNNASCEMHAKK